MRHSRFAALFVALGLGLFVTAPAAFADSATTVASASSDPVVTPGANGSYTVNVPGVGTLTFTVDPATGQVSGVTALVAPEASATTTAGTPTVTSEGVSVAFTDSSSGLVTTVSAEVDMEDGVPVVTAETETDEVDAENDQADVNETEHEGQAEPAAVEHEDGEQPKAPATTTTEAADHDGDSHESTTSSSSGGSESHHDSGGDSSSSSD